MDTSIKRHESLKQLSREHHYGLLLCWKIRNGFKKSVEPVRIQLYTNWFFENYLQPHFKEEEELIFPILGNEHKLVKKALSEHRRLQRLFNEKVDIHKSLSLIEEELERHIRFEERILFNELQNVISKEQADMITSTHDAQNINDNWHDKFWE
ncbi:MAG: hemerythrin domain-containing protein [Bacteroidia bacterium]